MDRNERETRDVAGVGPYAREREDLVALSTLESWKVSDGEPDIRGWDVRTVSNRQLGTVKDLLIDPKASEVVLMDVDLPGTDRHTFVPIRLAHIDRARRVVMMDSADLPDVDEAKGEVTKTHERHTADAGIVRYSRTDRPADRPRQNDDGGFHAEGAQRASAMDDTSITDRRRAERRIDRLSTDL